MSLVARCALSAVLLGSGFVGAWALVVDGTCATAQNLQGAACASQSLLQSRHGEKRRAAVVVESFAPDGGVTGAVEGAVEEAIAAVTGYGGNETPAAAASHDDEEWTYAAPTDWARVSVDCVGAEQSPVDVDTARVVHRDGLRSSLAPLLRYVEVGNLKLANNGHALQVNGAFGTLNLPDGPYAVKQFHFHCPSEHAIDGVLYQCEVHIVHQHVNATGTDRLAVIGILLQDSTLIAADLQEAFVTATERQLNFLESLGFASKLPEEGEEEALPDEFRLNLAQVFAVPLAGPFFHYQGSLTTPPCSESVHWYLLQRPGAIAAAMVARFKALFPAPANARPVQLLNGRVVVQGALQTTAAEFAPTGRRQDA